MWTKRNRMAVCTRIFEDLYWKELDIDQTAHRHFDGDELEDLIPGEKISPVDSRLVAEAAEYFHTKGEDYFQDVFSQYMDNWNKTLLPVQSVLYSWIIESDLTGVDRKELVGKYIKATQDLVAGGNTGLVHALLSKVSGTYHESEKNTDHERTEGESGSN